MSKSKNRGFRELRKPQQELPEVPDLGRLSMPRKGNRAAAKYVATIGPLWDRRRAERKARKNALIREDALRANPRRRHLDKAVRERMLRTMAGWSFDHKAKAFVAKNSAPERLDELIDAVVEIRAETVTLRVSGLSLQEAARVRGYLATGSLLVNVNAHLRGPRFA
ncbi:hypothetical protein ACFVU2_19365 [Leifsonia sp. NPDC058194]|uniref:hypothetical protein n=1 Tax=Leifsonia sp. NPDC058194 TaxID=3346374 RepID=UPI0036D84607